MILVDTSVWIDHLRKTDTTLRQLLEEDQVLSHPFVIGEIALGSFRQRDTILDELELLPIATVADHGEVLRLIFQHRLYGRGIGYIDAHLLASVRLTPLATLWTHDKRLVSVAESFNVEFRP